jgi:DNA-binding PadR family transcriptional regulator
MNDLIVLALLFDGPKHGYQLKREAGFILGQRQMHNNLIYPMLRRFTRQRWVSRKSLPGERGQTRLQYALTGKGREELLARLADYNEDDARSRRAFATRVGMFELLKPVIRGQILEKREAYLRELEKRLANLKMNMNVGSYGIEVLRFHSQQSRMEVAWIARLRRMHRKKPRGEKPANNL